MLDLRLAVTNQIYGDSPVKVQCPVHNDPSASLAVYRDNAHCFGCGWHRNNPDEVLAALLGIGLEEAYDKLEQFQGAYQPKEHKQLPPLPTSVARMYHKFLCSSMKHRVSWLLERGLTWNTIESQLLGHDGLRFTIPVFDASQNLLTIRYRRDDAIDTEGPKYCGMKGRNQPYLYGAQWLSGDYAIVTEGELDALRLWQQGLPAASITNGAGQTQRVPTLLQELLPNLLLVLVATDSDKAGDKAAVQTAQEASRLGLEVKRLGWLEGKDVTEALCLGATFYEQEWTGKGFGPIHSLDASHPCGRLHVRREHTAWENGGAGYGLQFTTNAA